MRGQTLYDERPHSRGFDYFACSAVLETSGELWLRAKEFFEWYLAKVAYGSAGAQYGVALGLITDPHEETCPMSIERKQDG